MGTRRTTPARGAAASDACAAPRRRLARRGPIRPSGCAVAAGLLLHLAGHCQADELSQTLTTRETLRQQEREQRLQPHSPDVRLKPPAPPGAPARLPSGESPCFVITRIELAGEAAEHFQWALAAADPPGDGASGRCLGSGGISLVMRRIENAIVARGYITTRILAAPQDLNGGTLRLTVIPGRLRDIRFAEGTDPRATGWNALPVGPGDLLDLRDLEQALENFQRVPGADADIRIVPAAGVGARPGESDLVTAWKQGFPLRLTLSADDAGSKATGKYQGAATLAYDHALTLNDLFFISFNHDLGGGDPGRHGTRGHSAHYSLPFGYWLLSFNAGRAAYHQSVAGASQTYRYSGENRTGEIRLARLVHRDATSKTGASLRGWLRASKNYIDDSEVLVQRRRMAGWEAGLERRQFLGRATLDLNLAYRRGTGAMDALPAPEEAFGEGTARPRLMTAEARLDLPFALGRQRLRYLGAWRGQWNQTPLVPQDRFAIGGRHSVRGFDGENLLSGDRGWLLRNEVGLGLGVAAEFYLGIDHGEVGGRSSDLLVGKRLTGGVLGLRGHAGGFAWDLFAGLPISKPEGFTSARRTLGFNLAWSL